MQRANADVSISTKPSGKITFSRYSHSQKVLKGIESLFPWLESSDKSAFLMQPQPLKTPSPKSSRDFGSLIEVSPKQPRKALLPNDKSPSLKSIFCKLSQMLNASSQICFKFFGKSTFFKL